MYPGHAHGDYDDESDDDGDGEDDPLLPQLAPPGERFPWSRRELTYRRGPAGPLLYLNNNTESAAQSLAALGGSLTRVELVAFPFFDDNRAFDALLPALAGIGSGNASASGASNGDGNDNGKNNTSTKRRGGGLRSLAVALRDPCVRSHVPMVNEPRPPQPAHWGYGDDRALRSWERRWTRQLAELEAVGAFCPRLELLGGTLESLELFADERLVLPRGFFGAAPLVAAEEAEEATGGGGGGRTRRRRRPSSDDDDGGRGTGGARHQQQHHQQHHQQQQRLLDPNVVTASAAAIFGPSPPPPPAPFVPPWDAGQEQQQQLLLQQQ